MARPMTVIPRKRATKTNAGLLSIQPHAPAIVSFAG
jgi:hypothetical protein